MRTPPNAVKPSLHRGATPVNFSRLGLVTTVAQADLPPAPIDVRVIRNDLGHGFRPGTPIVTEKASKVHGFADGICAMAGSRAGSMALSRWSAVKAMSFTSRDDRVCAMLWDIAW